MVETNTEGVKQEKTIDQPLRKRPDWNWCAPEHSRIALSMERDKNHNLILDPRPNIMVPPRKTYTIPPVIPENSWLS